MIALDAGGKKRKKPGQDAAQFKTDEEGKMVIDNEDEDGDAQMEEDVEGAAYREAITSADGFTRGPNGKIKFNKDTKKRRRDNADVDEDVEMADAGAPSKREKRKHDPKLGHEFKAKVHIGSPRGCILSDVPCAYRKGEVMSKRAAWTPMRTYRCRKPRRRRDAASGLALPANDKCTTSANVFYHHLLLSMTDMYFLKAGESRECFPTQLRDRDPAGMYFPIAAPCEPP